MWISETSFSAYFFFIPVQIKKHLELKWNKKEKQKQQITHTKYANNCKHNFTYAPFMRR